MKFAATQPHSTPAAAALARARASIGSDKSTPTQSYPFAAKWTHSRPVPQPKSTSRPGVGKARSQNATSAWASGDAAICASYPATMSSARM